MRGTASRRRRLTPILLSLLLAGGCMPHVLHAPRAERGTTAAIMGSLGRNLAFGETRNETYVPSLYTGAHHGIVSADDRAALLFGVQASPLTLLWFADTEEPEDFLDLLLATSYADVYVQPTGLRTPTWNAGAGALASGEVLAPYVQLGRTGETHGWFTTQMIAFLDEPVAETTLWLPSIGWRDRGRPESSRAVMIELGGAFPLDGDTDEWFFALTFTAELGLVRQ